MFWKANFIMGSLCLTLLVIYILGSLGQVNFSQWALKDDTGDNDHHFDANKWYRHLPLSVWFYIGVEMLPLAAKDSKHVSHIFTLP